MAVQERDSTRFFRKTLRHFAEMRNQAPAGAVQAQPFPDDWFDLSPEMLADYGAMTYLAGLTGYHRAHTLGQVSHYFEPPWRLGQYRIFRANGFPRAFITWAGLSPEAERAFAVEHQPIMPEQWNSGASVWLIDFVAPFGHVDEIVPLLTRNESITSVRTLWHNRTGERYRIVEWRRAPGEARVEVASYGVRQFAALLDGSA